MKTTILYYDRREGKTTELKKRMQEYHDLKDVLLLVPTYNHDSMYVNEKKRGLVIGSYVSLKNGTLRGSNPKTIMMEDIEHLNPEVFDREVAPMLICVRELIVTTSEEMGIELFTPHLRKHVNDMKDIMKECASSLQIGVKG